jgi:hypothetical protein
MEHIIDLHHDIMFFLFLIIIFVLYMLIQIIWRFSQNFFLLIKKDTVGNFININDLQKHVEYKRLPFLTHNTTIEII